MAKGNSWTMEALLAQPGIVNGTCRILDGAVTSGTTMPHAPSAAEVEAPKDRYKSATERWYAQLLDVEKAKGTLRHWWYEPQKGLYLAPGLSYTPDFLLQWEATPGLLEFHEVKGGHIYTKDWQRAKAAAALYPCYTFVLAQWTKQRWHWKRIPAV